MKIHAPKDFTVQQLTKLIMEEYLKNTELSAEALKYPNNPEGNFFS
jgi:hypothetical protein